MMTRWLRTLQKTMNGLFTTLTKWAILAISILALAFGCQSINSLPQFSFSGQTPEERRIAELMQWHASRVEVYKGFETVFTARALFLSDEVKRLTYEWEAKTKLLDPTEKAELFEKTAAPLENQIEFLLGFYTPDDSNEKLEQGDAEWRVKLRLPNGEIIRASCFGVGFAEENMYMRILRWDLSWSKLYKLCFPRSRGWVDPEAKGVTLIISGPRGRGEMLINTQPPLDY